MFSEKDMQDILELNPSPFLGNDAKVYGREFWVGTNNRIDFIFTDTREKRHLLVELQLGELNREHAERLWSRYIPYYEEMRPDVSIKGILMANSVSKSLEKECTERNIEVKCFSPEYFLRHKTTHILRDESRVPTAGIGRFTGFTLSDFEGIVKAERTVKADFRRSAIGKLYQLRDYLFENLPELQGDSFLDKKVSDKPYRQRLGVPWMAFYFGSNVAKSDKLPHVNITLAEESENGKFCMSEASVHVNAEIKPNFLGLLKLLTSETLCAELLEPLRSKGYELRYYSKIPLAPQNTNNNFWHFRSRWMIDRNWHHEDVVKWFNDFSENNKKEIARDIEEMRNRGIYGEIDYKFVCGKYSFHGNDNTNATDNLSAEGRSVLRLGKWWNPNSLNHFGESFKDEALLTIKELRPLFNYFREKKKDRRGAG